MSPLEHSSSPEKISSLSRTQDVKSSMDAVRAQEIHQKLENAQLDQEPYQDYARFEDKALLKVPSTFMVESRGKLQEGTFYMLMKGQKDGKETYRILLGDETKQRVLTPEAVSPAKKKDGTPAEGVVKIATKEGDFLFPTEPFAMTDPIFTDKGHTSHMLKSYTTEDIILNIA